MPENPYKLPEAEGGLRLLARHQGGQSGGFCLSAAAHRFGSSQSRGLTMPMDSGQDPRLEHKWVIHRNTALSFMAAGGVLLSVSIFIRSRR
jgi:hypothetical protein